MGPSGQGYISDYYLKNNANGGQKLIKRHGGNEGGVISGESEGADHINENPNSNNGGGASQNKLSNKKFFKSKIDFMAPIKSLRGPNKPNGA